MSEEVRPPGIPSVAIGLDPVSQEICRQYPGNCVLHSKSDLTMQ